MSSVHRSHTPTAKAHREWSPLQNASEVSFTATRAALGKHKFRTTCLLLVPDCIPIIATAWVRKAIAIHLWVVHGCVPLNLGGTVWIASLPFKS